MLARLSDARGVAPILRLLDETLLQHVLDDLIGFRIGLSLLFGLSELLLQAIIVRQLLLDGLLFEHGLRFLVQDLLLGSAPLGTYLQEQAASTTSLYINIMKVNNDN